MKFFEKKSRREAVAGAICCQKLMENAVYLLEIRTSCTNDVLGY